MNSPRARTVRFGRTCARTECPARFPAFAHDHGGARDQRHCGWQANARADGPPRRDDAAGPVGRRPAGRGRRAPPSAGHRCGGRRILRWRRRRAVRRSPAPAARRQGRGHEPRSGLCRAAEPIRSAGSSPTISIPSRRDVRRSRRSGYAAFGVWRDIRTQVAVHRRDLRGARVRRASPAQRALEGRVADLRAGRRRCAADRRADLVPARHDPRVPVGGADEALRRRDLRRRSHRTCRCCASSGR